MCVSFIHSVPDRPGGYGCMNVCVPDKCQYQCVCISLCVCVNMWVSKCVRTYVCVCVCVCENVHVYVCVHVWEHVHVCVCVCVCVWKHAWCSTCPNGREREWEVGQGDCKSSSSSSPSLLLPLLLLQQKLTAPALASTTSVPAFWMRVVSFSRSSCHIRKHKNISLWSLRSHHNGIDIRHGTDDMTVFSETPYQLKSGHSTGSVSSPHLVLSHSVEKCATEGSQQILLSTDTPPILNPPSKVEVNENSIKWQKSTIPTRMAEFGWKIGT